MAAHRLRDYNGRALQRSLSPHLRAAIAVPRADRRSVHRKLQFAGAAYVGRDDGQQAADLAQLLLLARFCDQRCGEGAETEPLQEFCTRDAAGTSRNARSGPVAQGLGGRGRGSGMPCMLCLSWIRHLPSNACSVFFWCRASGVATTVGARPGKRGSARATRLRRVRSTSGKSSKRNLTKRGFGICGGARCCREARQDVRVRFSHLPTYPISLREAATYLPIKIGVSLTADPLSGKDSEPRVVKVQPWRLSPPLAIYSSYR